MKKRNPRHVVSGQPRAIIAGKYRTLRTNIQFSIINQDFKVLPVTDIQIMSGKMNGVLFVVRMGIAQKENILKAKEMLDVAGVNVLDAVYNQVENSNVVTITAQKRSRTDD